MSFLQNLLGGNDSKSAGSRTTKVFLLRSFHFIDSYLQKWCTEASIQYNDWSQEWNFSQDQGAHIEMSADGGAWAYRILESDQINAFV
jgi:hypothetical protein